MVHPVFRISLTKGAGESAVIGCGVSYSDVVDYNTRAHASFILIYFSGRFPERSVHRNPDGARTLQVSGRFQAGVIEA
jgi:hypothetical protein